MVTKGEGGVLRILVFLIQNSTVRVTQNRQLTHRQKQNGNSTSTMAIDGV